ncbi:hypothetical protein [Flintibacter muris]|uniref:hypothetical protein n=1 Tax=Flintibacter muris TaxID=2941327 RepID=UPI00203E03BC|nr:hypothetical protein [Flintibacter muris]
MFKKLLTAALITSMLILPVNSAGPVNSPEASSPEQAYLPGDVPAETGAAESMTPALHALVLAMLNHDTSRFDFNNTALTWEGLYNMLSLYGQMDSRALSEQGELLLPEETVLDYAAALDLDASRLGDPPAAIRDRLNYDNVSRCYVVVCGEDDLAQVRVDSLRPSGQGYTLTGSLVYQVNGQVLASFQASLRPCDNMFGYVLTGMSITG